MTVKMRKAALAYAEGLITWQEYKEIIDELQNVHR